MSTTDPPTVSVIVPTRNRAELLPRAIRSVLAQTYPDFELVIVDDGSSDNTPAVVAGFADHRIRSLRHRRNFGQSKALNTGIESARGQYVAFLDDDDEWLPHKLADQVAVFDAAPAQVGLVSGWIDVIDDGGRCVRKGRWRLRGDVFEHMLALRVPTLPSLWLVRTSVARAIGGFDEDIHFAKDVEFCTRLCEHGWHVDFAPSVVALKYEHSMGQLTDPTESNLAARADVVRRHLTKFTAELRERPKALATVHVRLARHLQPYGKRRELLRSLAIASRLDPIRVLDTCLPNWWAVRFCLKVLRSLQRRLQALRSSARADDRT